MPSPPPIWPLPPDVAERIAAGEVIERPASVVRELLDNAIDAGATDVTIEVRAGGLALIRVADDGWGIPPEQVELAFERHATSKLRALDDLQRLDTLGFRGEALPSIAAVAEVTLLTRDEASDLGTLLTVRGGAIVKHGRAARQRGTTVTVRHLFHTVPARLKFLAAGGDGAPRSESAAVAALVRRYALARPDLRLTLVADGRPVFRSAAAGRLEAALAALYGPAIADSMLPLDTAVAPLPSGYGLHGLLSNRTVTRPARHHLTLILNGRAAASRGLQAAIEAAYRPHLPRGRHPIGVVVLTIPPADLDPNVHPAKTEVRLLREAEVAEALAAVVRHTLANAPAQPSAAEDFSLATRQYTLPTPARRLAEASDAAWGSSPGAFLAELAILAQVRQTLILAEGPAGLYLVDQHRAHERIVYERLVARERDAPEAQHLLEPVVLELKPQQAALLDQRLSSLEALGFDCARFGGRDFLVRAAPAIPGGRDLLADLPGLLEEVAADPSEGWRERLLASLACRAAVRRDQPLADADMRSLLADLARTPTPASCPHGSPLILQLPHRFLARQFNW